MWSSQWTVVGTCNAHTSCNHEQFTMTGVNGTCQQLIIINCHIGLSLWIYNYRPQYNDPFLLFKQKTIIHNWRTYIRVLKYPGNNLNHVHDCTLISSPLLIFQKANILVKLHHFETNRLHPCKSILNCLSVCHIFLIGLRHFVSHSNHPLPKYRDHPPICRLFFTKLLLSSATASMLTQLINKALQFSVHYPSSIIDNRSSNWHSQGRRSSSDLESSPFTCFIITFTTHRYTDPSTSVW